MNLLNSWSFFAWNKEDMVTMLGKVASLRTAEAYDRHAYSLRLLRRRNDIWALSRSRDGQQHIAGTAMSLDLSLEDGVEAIVV